MRTSLYENVFSKYCNFNIFSQSKINISTGTVNVNKEIRSMRMLQNDNLQKLCADSNWHAAGNSIQKKRNLVKQVFGLLAVKVILLPKM